MTALIPSRYHHHTHTHRHSCIESDTPSTNGDTTGTHQYPRRNCQTDEQRRLSAADDVLHTNQNFPPSIEHNSNENDYNDI